MAKEFHQKKPPKFPNQSDKGKCELRINDLDLLYCHKLKCPGECVLYSLPNTDPHAKPEREIQPCGPSGDRYYFCKCVPKTPH